MGYTRSHSSYQISQEIGVVNDSISGDENNDDIFVDDIIYIF